MEGGSGGSTLHFFVPDPVKGSLLSVNPLISILEIEPIRYDRIQKRENNFGQGLQAQIWM